MILQAVRGGVLVVLAGFFAVILLCALFSLCTLIAAMLHNAFVAVADWYDRQCARESRRSAGGHQ